MKTSTKRMVNYATNLLDALDCEFKVILPDGGVIENKKKLPEPVVTEKGNKALLERFYFQLGSTGNYRWRNSGLYRRLATFTKSDETSLLIDISHLGKDSAKSLQATCCKLLTATLGKDSYTTKTLKSSQVIRISKKATNVK